ncbi:MAG: sialidase family protein [Candidatus Merdivicinus sp.]|jgi:predicted neuraminidase
MEYRVLNHQHLFGEGEYFPQCHASTLALLPDGVLATAWFGGTHEKSPDVAIWFSRRMEGRWTVPVKAADAEGIPCWNPVLLYRDGILTLFYKVGKEIPEWKTFVRRSSDGGIHWSEPEELVTGDLSGGRGPVKNKCICLHDGTILAPASVETADRWDCFADRSTDGGKSWMKGTFMPIDHASLQGKGIIQPTFWEDENHILHALMRSTEGWIFQTRSTDGGIHWEPVHKTSLPNNNSGLDAVRLEDGRIVLVCNPISGNWASRATIAFLVSEDQGETWSDPIILEHLDTDYNQHSAEFSYPAVIADGTRIFLTYTWKRKSISFWEIQL